MSSLFLLNETQHAEFKIIIMLNKTIFNIFLLLLLFASCYLLKIDHLKLILETIAHRSIGSHVHRCFMWGEKRH